MASQITANLPALDFPKEVDYPTQEDWAAFSAAAEENFGILSGDWSTQMQLWKTQANAMSTELNTNADLAQSIANYQGDWTSKGYTLGQTVSVSGVYYICKLTHATGQNPTNVGSLYWNLALGNWSLKIDKDISPYTSKTTPVDADLIPLSDSASSFGIKKLSWVNIKATLKTYFDSLYMSLTGNQTVDGNKSFTGNILVISPSSAIGYGAGSGGAVVQATSKSTAVTLNKPSGKVITHDQALAPGASVIFNFNNSLFSASDLILCEPLNSGAYRVEAVPVSNGVFSIRITNIITISLSEALGINFVIIKGAIA